MKKYIALFVLALTALLPNTAKADINEGLYATVFGGGNWVSKNHHRNFDVGYVVSGSVGYKFCWCDNSFRGEFEIAYRSNNFKRRLLDSSELSDSDDSSSNRNRRHLNTTSYLFNALYDIDMCWCVVPYVGAGLGYGHTTGFGTDHFIVSEAEDSSEDGRRHFKKSGFAYQFILGAAYPICCDQLDITLEYRFFHVDSGKGFSNNSVGAGIRYWF